MRAIHLVLLASILIIPNYSIGGTRIEQPISVMIKQSETVVYGNVVSKRYEEVDESDEVFTVLTLSPFKVLSEKGFQKYQGIFEIRHWGGRRYSQDVKGKAIEELYLVTGVPEVEIGSDILAFLKSNGKAHIPFTTGPNSFLFHDVNEDRLINSYGSVLSIISHTGYMRSVTPTKFNLETEFEKLSFSEFEEFLKAEVVKHQVENRYIDYAGRPIPDNRQSVTVSYPRN